MLPVFPLTPSSLDNMLIPLDSTSSTPVPTSPASSSVVAPTSTPLVPSGAGPTGSPVPSQPPYNAGAMNAATGAGAGLAAVFGAAALLL